MFKRRLPLLLLALSWPAQARVLSTTRDATVGGILYRDGDLFRYSLVTGAHALFLSESLFGGADEDIDAVSFAVPESDTLLLVLTGLLALGGRAGAKSVGFFFISPKNPFCSD